MTKMPPTLPLLLLMLLFLVCAVFLPPAAAQTPAAPAPASSSCNGVFVSYSYNGGIKISPTDPTNQPYRFTSTLRVSNHGRTALKFWQVFVGFKHDEYLVSASNAVLADGTGLPAAVGNGTVFAGYPSTDLKTAIETAGDDTQTSVEVDLIGTQFGVPLTQVPWPSSISLANDGFLCPTPTTEGDTMYVCCTEDATATSKITVAEEFLPRQTGDLTVMYDVIRTYESYYWAQVTIGNHNPLGRLDNWKLSWEWMRGEFIYSMKGAYPNVVDSSECIFGDQGTYYSGIDFSSVLSCERKPTIIDLPPNMYNDTALGFKPSCCRNGTILPPSMDPSKSTSAFQLQVYKMPPDLNRSVLTPPQNWKINGTLNPDYQCAPPIRVSPSEFPDSSGVSVNSTAVASWQVVCNISHPKGVSPRCCVSFSAYYNDSVIPCGSCACGCPSNTARTCSATAPALLLPSQAQLIPFENRTALTLAWASIKHLTVPSPMPCGDNCGVSINWHVYTDYSKGWSARITLFNWDETSFVDWFAAVELDKAAAGFEKAYSFNGSTVDGVNNTIIMQGLPGLNYLVAEADGANPIKDYRVPGKQQSVISFTKKLTPGIKVATGDGFPTKVYFNGEECALPSILPSGGSHRKEAIVLLPFLAAVFVVSVLTKL